MKLNSTAEGAGCSLKGGKKARLLTSSLSHRFSGIPIEPNGANLCVNCLRNS